MHVQPYLFFDGRCEEAIAFYTQSVGAKTEVVMRYKDSPDKSMCAPGNENKVMHACIKIGDTQIMASDGQAKGKPNFDGFALSITAKDGTEAKARFDALSDGGAVVMPLAKTFFAAQFGMVKDRFGVHWMVLAQ